GVCVASNGDFRTNNRGAQSLEICTTRSWSPARADLGRTIASSLVWWPQPICGVVMCKLFHVTDGNRANAVKRKKLVVKGLPGVRIGEHCGALSSLISLERQGDEVAERSASRGVYAKLVLGWKQSIIASESHGRALGHCTMKQRHSSATRSARGHGFFEEKPDVGTVAGARYFCE